ncbi:YppE family protein [Sporolactobacillus vineae]|uniref:YppE family protein n=1 Tax=Sporolactobacillus vineae TaxID=444463 RepID=UPI000288268E|nr:YppE family protein [Sporolactobacillus vineae]
MNNPTDRLRKTTKELKMLNKKACDQFMNVTTLPGYQVDFQGRVKPFADLMQSAVNAWKPMAGDWVRKRKPRYVHPEQIKATCENLQIVCVTAFQEDTRRRRFIETIEAIDFVLDTLLTQLDADRKNTAEGSVSGKK